MQNWPWRQSFLARRSGASCSPLIDLAIVRTDSKHYWLTPRVLRLSLSYLSTLPYWREAQVALEELSSISKQSCALSVLDGEDIVYLQRQHAKRILPVSPTLGSRLPAYAVSMGRVLLSGLPDDELDAFLRTVKMRRLTSVTITDAGELKAEILKVREQGYAWGEREFDDSNLRPCSACARHERRCHCRDQRESRGGRIHA